MRADDSPSIDAFSRWRISESEGLFDSTFQYDLSSLTYEALTTGAGTVTHNANQVSAVLSVAGGTDSAILQSRAYHRYIPAKSQLVVMTEVVGAAVANVLKRWGYFDANDGLFFEQNGTTDVAVVRRTSTSGAPVDNRVVQASWNLDPLDGTGPSGITLDLANSQIIVIDFQWLGMGRIRMGFDIDGLVVYCHEFLNANVLAVPYMRTGNLPNRWEIISAGGAGTLMATCASVISEGGKEADRGTPFVAESAIAAGSGVDTALLSIRPLLLYKTQVNRIQIQPLKFSALVTGNNPVIMRVWYNATATAGAWNPVDAESSVEFNATPTGFAGGVHVGTVLIPATNQAAGAASEDFSARLPLTLDINGANPIELLLTGNGVGGASAMGVALGWKELK